MKSKDDTLPDERTDDELRACIHSGAPADRVHAAFELGMRLGSGVLPELSLGEQRNSGVRRHWLTMLAAYGERAAVLTVANADVSSAEGEHALRLALQLRLGDSSWLANRFNATTEHMQSHLLHQSDAEIDWDDTVPTLEALLRSDFAHVRIAAAKRLLSIQPAPGCALREFALSRQTEASAAIVEAWARGDDHAQLVAHLPHWVEREDVGLAALLEAGRRYPLAFLHDVVIHYSPALALVTTPCGRDELLLFLDAAIGAQAPNLPTDFLKEVGVVLTAPWSANELELFSRWSSAARTYRDGYGDELVGWEGELLEEAVLRAVGFAQ